MGVIIASTSLRADLRIKSVNIHAKLMKQCVVHIFKSMLWKIDKYTEKWYHSSKEIVITLKWMVYKKFMERIASRWALKMGRKYIFKILNISLMYTYMIFTFCSIQLPIEISTLIIRTVIKCYFCVFYCTLKLHLSVFGIHKYLKYLTISPWNFKYPQHNLE